MALFALISICTIFPTILAYVCNEANECRNDVITGAEAGGITICNGFNGCYAADINNQVDNVECSGVFSCKNAIQIKTVEALTCSGYQSCYGASSITPLNQVSTDALKCYGESSCRNIGMIRKNGTRTECYGPSSCKQSNINSNNLLKCYNKNSCQSTTIHIHNNAPTYPPYTSLAVYCYATKACYDSDITNLDSKILCYGRNACSNSIIRADALQSIGYYTSANSQIFGATDIESVGYYALYNSQIDSDTTTVPITIHLFGYLTGTDASIMCRSGATCSLECEGNACKDLTFSCLSGATCVITPTHCTLPANSGALIDGINCPIYQQSNTNRKDKSLRKQFNKWEVISFSDIDEYMYQSDINDADVLLETDGLMDSNCKQPNECSGAVIDNTWANAICLGPSSCSQATINFNDDIQCLGLRSCIDAIEINSLNGKIECKSPDSCRRAGQIVSKKAVKCMGDHSCSQVNEIRSTTNNIISEGYFSTYKSNLFANENIYCEGESSCAESNITANSKVFCGAYESCRKTNIDANDIICDGFDSCPRSNLNAQRNIFIYGPLAATSSFMTGTNIYGYGSLAGSGIDSGNLKVMNVYFYGWRAGYNVDIICRRKAICNLNCKHLGCIGTKLSCQKGSTCNVNPVECDGTISEFEGTTCPSIMFSDSKYMDEEMAFKLSDKKYFVEMDSLYLKMQSMRESVEPYVDTELVVMIENSMELDNNNILMNENNNILELNGENTNYFLINFILFVLMGATIIKLYKVCVVSSTGSSILNSKFNGENTPLLIEENI